VDDRLSQPYPLGHAFRVPADTIATATVEAHHRHDPRNSRTPFGRTQASQTSVEVEQCVAGQPVVKTKVLRQIADSPARVRVARGQPEQARLACSRRDEAEQNFDGRRLARTVGAQKAEDLAGLDVQVQPVQRDLLAVLLAKSDRFERGWRQRTTMLSAMGFRSFAFRVPAMPNR
jgi:hypothetical protein